MLTLRIFELRWATLAFLVVATVKLSACTATLAYLVHLGPNGGSPILPCVLAHILLTAGYLTLSGVVISPLGGTMLCWVLSEYKAD